MKRRYVVFVVAALIPVGLAVILARWRDRKDEEERGHFTRRETELIVAAARKGEVTLYNAGSSVAESAQTPGFNGVRIWLRAGNYFLRSETSGRSYYFPVPVTGYRRGPDADGDFFVFVREPPNVKPPLLLPSSADYAYIPSGSFLIGDRLNPREPHYVWLTGYFISPFETVNAEFRLFLADPAGYNDDANWCVAGKKWKAANSSQATARLNPSDADFERFGKDDLPVLWVNWYEANAYCRWLTRRIGGTVWQFSLPTDAEWEKSARGPDNFDYALGMRISDSETHLYNWKKNPDARVTAVGIGETLHLYKPNRYGLYHMTGNANEWAQSIPRLYNKDHPYVDDDRNRDDVPGQRSVRGGSWYSASVAYLYIPYRDSFQPEHCNQELGFRVVAKMMP